MHKLGAITGLRFEARLLARAAARRGDCVLLPPIAVGGSPERAHDAALRLADQGAAMLLSFGLGGGLDPALRPGEVVIAARVSTLEQPSLATDPNWTQALAQALAQQPQAIITSPRAIVRATEKAALYQSHGAVLVDMESYGVAAAAQARGLPFASVRAVADPAVRGIPSAAMAGMAADGSTKPGAVLAALVRNPGDLPGLLQVARDSSRARRALSRVALLHPALFGIR
ncbi:MAG: purine phosphorylase [Sphingomonadales bacterium]